MSLANMLPAHVLQGTLYVSNHMQPKTTVAQYWFFLALSSKAGMQRGILGHGNTAARCRGGGAGKEPLLLILSVLGRVPVILSWKSNQMESYRVLGVLKLPVGKRNCQESFKAKLS